MKKSISIFLFLGLTTALSRLALHAHYPSPAPGAAQSAGFSVNSGIRTAKTAISATSESNYRGGCTAYLKETLSSGGTSSPDFSARDELRGQAKRSLDSFFGSDSQLTNSAILSKDVRFAIAIVPDPSHTNLGLFLDRQIVSIQQAAQDSGYDYDSAWLPWERGSSAPLNNLLDRQRAAFEKLRRESCPGVLLFRKHQPATDSDSFASGLVLFLVGEQPTGGINQLQWDNAIHWMATVPPRSDQSGYLRVLGPTFSGSFRSLKRNLAKVLNTFPNILVLSGSVTSNNEISAFKSGLGELQQKERENRRNSVLSFGSFNENDELQISRFLEYEAQQGKQPSEVAILSEDETAYAVSDPETSYRFPSKQAGNLPLDLKYPRDIAVMRDAYQRQSVFDMPLTSDHPLRLILRDQTDPSIREGLDSLPGFSGDISALDQEAKLFGILDHLRVHHIRYLILRSTNPLDMLFLSRFFHRSYPEARIVTVGSDLLFRREIDTTEFRGMLALSSYPLVAREPDWRQFRTKTNRSGGSKTNNNPRDRRETIMADQPVHQIFTGNMSEGTYMAARYLLEEDGKKGWRKDTHLDSEFGSLNFELVDRLPAYGDPNWLDKHPVGSVNSRPPTWLSTLGRDGYWSVAALNEVANMPNSSMVTLNDRHSEGLAQPNFSMPLSDKLCFIFALLLAVYQLWGMSDVKLFTSDDLFFVFVNNPMIPTQPYLRGINAALALMPLVELCSPRILLSTKGMVGWSTFSVLSVGVVCALFLLTWFCTLKPWKRLESDEGFLDLTTERRIARTKASLIYVYAVLIFSSVYLLPLIFHGKTTQLFPLIYRMEHLTSGVSPLVPVLILTFGLYLWTWQTMAGNLLVGAGRPMLPLCRKPVQQRLPSKWRRLLGRYHVGLGLRKSKINNIELWKLLHPEQYRLSDGIAKAILLQANPFHYLNIGTMLIGSVLFLVFLLCFFPAAQTLSLEGKRYNYTLTAILLVASFLTVIEAFHLFSTWVQLRRLLLALGRSRLRLAISRYRPISPHSLWTVSTNVHRIQYRLFFQQYSALKRLVELHGICGTEDCLVLAKERGHKIVLKSRGQTRQGVARLWWSPFEPTDDGRNIREIFSDATAYIMREILWEHGERDKLSLYLNDELRPSYSPRDSDGVTIDDHGIGTAEEFVCTQYISFTHNVIARMRTMTMAMVVVFGSMCFALSSYPFAPRNNLSALLFINFVLIGSTVAYVYAGMDRDEILSSIANTNPGRLGTEYWTKLAAFLVGPLIGIVASQYPSIADSVLGWFQSGASVIK